MKCLYRKPTRVGRERILRRLRGANLGQALVTAFSTASSSATLPVTFECVKEKNDVSPTSADLVLPLGATINMDGTALYEAVAAIFIAQSYGVPLGFGAQVVIFFTVMVVAMRVFLDTLPSCPGSTVRDCPPLRAWPRSRRHGAASDGV